MRLTCAEGGRSVNIGFAVPKTGLMEQLISMLKLSRTSYAFMTMYGEKTENDIRIPSDPVPG